MSDIDLTSDEVKTAIAAAVAEATEGLKAKNTELLGKLQKAKKDSAIDPAEHAALEAELSEAKEKLTDATKAAGKLQKDLDAANKRATDIDSAYAKSIADSALTEALTKAGVTSPALLKAAKALHGSALQVTDESGVRTVKAGDKALGDFITEWAGSDEGKHFIAPTNSNGGGSNGGTPHNANPGDKLPDLTDKAGRVAVINARLAATE